MAEFVPLNPHVEGLTLYTFYGNTRQTSALFGSGTTWYFPSVTDTTPIVRDDMRLIGYRGVANPFFIVNFQVEPITGTLTLNTADSTGITHISGTYDQYNGFTQFVIGTDTWDPSIPDPSGNTDITGRTIYDVKYSILNRLDFSIMMRTENVAINGVVSDAIEKSEQFMILDAQTDRAYEGFLRSKNFRSVNKGKNPFAPATLYVQQYGTMTAVSGVIESIDWEGAYG